MATTGIGNRESGVGSRVDGAGLGSGVSGLSRGPHPTCMDRLAETLDFESRVIADLAAAADHCSEADREADAAIDAQVEPRCSRCGYSHGLNDGTGCDPSILRAGQVLPSFADAVNLLDAEMAAAIERVRRELGHDPAASFGVGVYIGRHAQASSACPAARVRSEWTVSLHLWPPFVASFDSSLMVSGATLDEAATAAIAKARDLKRKTEMQRRVAAQIEAEMAAEDANHSAPPASAKGGGA